MLSSQPRIFKKLCSKIVMSEESSAAPARLNMEETAWFLGFAPHDIPILIQAGLLKPLGHPPLHGTKYFAPATVERLRTDLKWLARASDTIVGHWKKKNKQQGDEDLDLHSRSQDRSRSLVND
jgi:hypothetical protein